MNTLIKSLALTIFLSWAFHFSAYLQQTVILQPGPVDGMDCYINSAFPDVTGGLNEGLIACAWTFNGAFGAGRSLIKFDLAAIPQGAIVTSAFLTLYFDASIAIGQQFGANASFLQPVTAPWDQLTTTWNNKPPVTTVGQISIPATLTLTEDLTDIDMTALVQGWVNNPATNFGFMHRMQVEVIYCSEVYASSNKPIPSMRPKLVVTYACDFPVALGADRTICAGNSTTFDAGFCTGCMYQWDNLTSGQTNIGTGQTYTTGIAGEYQVTVVVANGCYGSDAVQLFVDPLVPVSLSILASAISVCSGTAVSYTAGPVNGGATPAYQWQVDGVNEPGATNSTFIFVPVNENTIQCMLTSSEICTAGNPVTSNMITMNVDPLLPVSLSVSPSSNPICEGSSVTMTTIPANGGITPEFQWQVNGVNIAGATSPAYSFIPSSGNTVQCFLTSSESCTMGNPAPSNTVVMTVNQLLPVSLSIAASINPVCTGSPVAFTTIPVNGGSSPVFQWMVNGGVTGANSNLFQYTPIAGDLVSCLMSSELECVSNNPALSGNILMSTHPQPDVTFSICFNNITSTNAQPFILKGGLPLGGLYSGTGVNSNTGIFDPAIAGEGTHPITYSYTNTNSCTSTAIRNIDNMPVSSFTCGTLLTDIRDNKTYPTVQIGSQCWMQTNLDFGATIDDLLPQTDNCIVEKYIHNSSFAYSSFYQWDELMRYSHTQSAQGICPTGWHIPSSSEWDQLLIFIGGPGIAGGFLKDMFLSNGFHSEQDGILYMNKTWAFTAGEAAGSMYWTSTISGTTRAWARGINDFNLSVSKYNGVKCNAFSVRCLSD